MAKKPAYGNDSISALKGADRVRRRPAVIFGSDGLEGCEHSIFEILSNSIDEAREGFGNKIIVTRYEDHSVEVEDFGRGIPVDFNQREQRYNWELVFCEMYAGGKYNNAQGGSYEYSLGLNGLGLCATQYAAEYMDVDIRSGGSRYTLHFEKGENVGGLHREDYSKKDTGTRIRWKPDLEVFTDINVPAEYYLDIIKRQAIVNDGVTFIFRNEVDGKFETTEFSYENGIVDHAKELAGKPAVFKVKIKEIKVRELPELNDEFASEVSDFETLEEYKKDVEAKIAERKQKAAATENENRVVDKVVEGASMEIPDRMIDGQVENMIQDTARRMQSQGLDLQQYLKYTGMTLDQMKEQARPQAIKRIQTRLVLEAVAKAENIQISDERLDEELQKMADAYKMEVEKLKEYMGENEKNQMRQDLAVQAAVDLLVAEAKLV